MAGMLMLMAGSLSMAGLYLLLRLLYGERLRMESRLGSIQTIGSTESGEDDEVLQRPLAERVFYPVLSTFGKRMQKLAPSALKENLALKLGQAGVKSSADQYAGWYIVTAGAGMAIGALLSLLGRRPAAGVAGMALLFGAAGLMLPELSLRQRVTRRQKDIVRALPDVLDLLTVSVKAGLGFDSALHKVTEKMKGPLPQEMGQVLHEIRMGVVRKEALRSLSERTGVEALQSFVSTIIQADQLGVSISSVLQLQSEALREKRRQAAEEQAMKAPVKMLFPLIIFVFPTLFIVLLAPAVIQIIGQLRF
jgi:tight adherence protein C